MSVKNIDETEQRNCSQCGQLLNVCTNQYHKFIY